MLNRRELLKSGASVSASFAFGTGIANAKSDKNHIVETARRLLGESTQRITHVDRMALVDFSLPSWKPRFHVVDLTNGDITSHLVAHGRGSDPKHTGWLQHFSNDVGSNATSGGAYKTGTKYRGKYGEAMRLIGLDVKNSNAQRRAIVIHSAWYAAPEMINNYGKLGRSEGCFAFSDHDRNNVIGSLGEGRLIYAGKF